MSLPKFMLKFKLCLISCCAHVKKTPKVAWFMRNRIVPSTVQLHPGAGVWGRALPSHMAEAYEKSKTICAKPSPAVLVHPRHLPKNRSTGLGTEFLTMNFGGHIHTMTAPTAVAPRGCCALMQSLACGGFTLGWVNALHRSWREQWGL